MANDKNQSGAAAENAQAVTDQKATQEAQGSSQRIAALERQLAESMAKASEVDGLKAMVQELLSRTEKAELAITAGLQPESVGASLEELEAESDGIKLVLNDERVKILVSADSGDNGKSPVHVSVNGHQFIIPRDTESLVPRCVYNALLNAAHADFGDTGTGVKNQNMAMIPRFNVRRLD